MMRNLVSEFIEYKKKVIITRVRAIEVPEELRPLYDCYIGYLMNRLSDPDEQSIEILGPNEHYNAMAMVKFKFGIKQEREIGNCHRCGGSGVITAYRHIMNGKCMRCGGSGWIKP